MYTWAKVYASQSKAVSKPSWLKTNHAHFDVEDSTYSYSVFENSSEIRSFKCYRLRWWGIAIKSSRIRGIWIYMLLKKFIMVTGSWTIRWDSFQYWSVFREKVVIIWSVVCWLVLTFLYWLQLWTLQYILIHLYIDIL